MITENLAIFLADFGVPCVFGSYTPQVLLDAPGQDLLGNRAISISYRIYFVSAQLPGLAFRSAITVNSVAFTVNEVLPIDDGIWSEAKLEKT